MKTLIVEDDFTSRLLLQEILKRFGEIHIAVNGKEAVAAVRSAMDAGVPYDLICLDMMMPEMDGREASETNPKHGRSARNHFLPRGEDLHDDGAGPDDGCHPGVLRVVRRLPV